MASMSQIRPLRCTTRIARVRAIGDARLDGLGAHVDRTGRGVGEYGDVPGADQALHGAEIADRAHDDLIARFEVEGRRQHSQRRRASRRGDAVDDAVGLGEGALSNRPTMSQVSPESTTSARYSMARGPISRRKGLRQRSA